MRAIACAILLLAWTAVCVDAAKENPTGREQLTWGLIWLALAAATIALLIAGL